MGGMQLKFECLVLVCEEVGWGRVWFERMPPGFIPKPVHVPGVHTFAKGPALLVQGCLTKAGIVQARPFLLV